MTVHGFRQEQVSRIVWMLPPAGRYRGYNERIGPCAIDSRFGVHAIVPLFQLRTSGSCRKAQRDCGSGRISSSHGHKSKDFPSADAVGGVEPKNRCRSGHTYASRLPISTSLPGWWQPRESCRLSLAPCSCQSNQWFHHCSLVPPR